MDDPVIAGMVARQDQRQANARMLAIEVATFYRTLRGQGISPDLARNLTTLVTNNWTGNTLFALEADEDD